jgi:predicted KAP-like P-loop ATPase
MILTDAAIVSRETDRLRRSPLASRVAAMIRNFKGSESYVIGIEGEWGAGKSSFINLITEELAGGDVKVALFNPWVFSNQDQLVVDFFKTLFGEMQESEANPAIAKRLKTYVPKLLSKVDVPKLLSKVDQISVGPFFGVGWSKEHGSVESYQKDRQKLDRTLKATSGRVLVIIDDIDRLDAPETKLIFKLVKLMADFPNTVFMLAYDRLRVEQRLSDESTGFSGSDYLKKIIQVSFSIPKPDSTLLQTIFLEDLNATIEELYGKSYDLAGDDKHRLNYFLDSGLLRLMGTIRDIKRYISSLRLTWSAIGIEEINPVDFIGIEAIRVFAPRFYGLMPTYKTLFTRGGVTYYSGHDKKDKEASEKLYGELLAVIPDAQVREATSVISKSLFPGLSFHFSYGSEIYREWSEELRVCASDKFDVYFQLGVSEGEISELELKGFTANLDDEKAIRANVLALKEEGKVEKMVNRLKRYIKDIRADRSERLLKVLYDLGDEIHRPGGEVSLNSTAQLVTYLALTAMLGMPADARKKLLEFLLRECKSLYYVAYLAASVVAEVSGRGPSSRDRVDFTDEEVEQAKLLGVAHIEAAASSGELATHQRLAFFLFRWMEWTDEKTVHRYIRQTLLSTPSGIGILIECFLVTSHTSDRVIRELDTGDLGKLYPLTLLQKTVNALSEEDLQTLTMGAALAIKLFKEHGPVDLDEDSIAG